jgi:shikimate dehydrogenase
VIANRTVGKAQSLVARHATLAAAHEVRLAAVPLEGVAGRFDVVINATATSLSGAGVPVPGSVLKPGALAYDMMYGPAAEGFLDWAREHDSTGRDGLGMLVEQAAEAFLVWRGVRPPSGQVLAELREELAA